MKKITHTLLGCLGLVAMASCTPKQAPEENQVQECEAVVEEKNEVIDAIMARRSIRKYKDLPVERQVLDAIMECGINAPNGMNKQSWEVRIVDQPEVMQEIKKVLCDAYPEREPEQVTGCFRGAPVMVFIARDKGYDFSAYDCGLMAGNMVLSATSMGVGSICLGSPVRMINDNPACASILERLNFSEGYELCLCVGLGYADENPEAKPRNKDKVKYVE